MEDTLRDIIRFIAAIPMIGLNPCFNGRYSQRISQLQVTSAKTRLNPCFNGRYSQRRVNSLTENAKEVLILVLMEDTLRDSYSSEFGRTFCLNPCFNGRYSQRARHTNPLYKRDWHL